MMKLDYASEISQKFKVFKKERISARDKRVALVPRDDLAH